MLNARAQLGQPSSAAEGLSLALLLRWGGWSGLGGHVGCEVIHPATVAIFTVAPGNELYNLVMESSASSSIKGGRVGVTIKVTGDNLALSVVQDAR